MNLVNNKSILINCDVGESFGCWSKGADAQIMPYIDLANIACGFHASDSLNMETTVSLAKAANVVINAHPGYPDLLGLGRRPIALSADEVRCSISYQMWALQGICSMHNVKVEYVKPHDALYNAMMKDFSILKNIMLAVKNTLPDCPLMVMATPRNQAVKKLAANVGINVLFEAFSDRAYDDEGYLVDRKVANSTYSDLKTIIEQAKQIMQDSSVTT